MNRLSRFCGLLLLALLTGCATTPYDYSAFRASKPKSILVLPPINHTPEVTAGAGLMSQVSFPLAESGYYVFPVAVVTETFRQNGLEQPDDIQALPLNKINQIFKADSVLYLEVLDYGTSYAIIASDTRVTAKAKLVDARGGQVLWEGQATASTAEQQNNNSGGGLAGLLVQALVTQIIETASDRSYEIAGITSTRLLSAAMPNGILYGPRSPQYATQNAEPNLAPTTTSQSASSR